MRAMSLMVSLETILKKTVSSWAVNSLLLRHTDMAIILLLCEL